MASEGVIQFVRHNALSVTFSLLICFLIYKLVKRKRNLPPGPLGLPLIGILHEVKDADRIQFDFHRYAQKYGDIYSCYMGRQLMILLNSYDVIKEAFLTRGDDFNDRLIFATEFTDFIEDFFAAPYNSAWKEKKKFAVQALKNTGFGTPKSEEKLTNEIGALVRFLEDQNGSAFDPKKPLDNTAANSLISTLLNLRFPWNSDELNRVIKAAEDFMFGLSDSITLTFIHQYLPLFLIKIFCKEQVNKCQAKLDKLRAFIREQVEMHKATFDPNYTRDLIDTYLKAEKDEKIKYLINSLSAFFPDGTSTASDSMNWAVLYLAYHPEDQKTAQKQIDKVCGSRCPTLADRKDLPFMEAIFAETMRIGNPAAISGPHVPLKETTLRGYTIPRDGTTGILANLYSCHMNPKDFPEPEKFNPSRFINKDGKLVNTERVIPFGIGTRMCVGAQYTKSIFFLTISHILQRFTLQFPADQPNPSLEPDKFLTSRPQPYKVCAVLR